MRTGTDAETGMLLTGWDHCVQSIRKCLTTRIASRVIRRHLGCLVPELQDQNADPRTIFKVYVAIAEALADPDGGEPGFGLRTIELVEAGRSGRFVFLLDGIFFPRGHLGDFSIREDRQARLDIKGASA
ncbi:MAG: baseplate assembly protein [Pseudomonadota bacterium]|nr:baseplate assembly protein [Pseudomonadota bacterium]